MTLHVGSPVQATGTAPNYKESQEQYADSLDKVDELATIALQAAALHREYKRSSSMRTDLSKPVLDLSAKVSVAVRH